MRLVVLAALPLLLAGQELQTVQVAVGITSPTDIQHAGDGSGRLFLVEQAGVIRILRNGNVLAQPFLDIRDRVNDNANERGLLGLAFAPGYENSGRFYLNYTNSGGHTVIAQYRVSGNPDAADAASETILLTINQPFSNHNGGQLQFGADGYLYIATGDGGSGGDPQNHGQRLDSLLGKILRLDVESQPGQVRIPPQNPFVNQGGARGEIWAYGLRNPWRFSFDRVTHDLYIADVGQNLYEEVDFQPASSTGGENYGWRTMEGLHCFNPSNCSQQGLTLPVWEYSQSGTQGCSVTGGFVYRGRRSPGMRGTYIYGDLCNGQIWGLTRQGSQWVNRLMLSSGLIIQTFGEDEAGEIYLGAANGRVYRLDGPRNPLIASGAAVTNSASFQSGMVAGSLATVFVAGVMDDEGSVTATELPLASNVGGVSVTVDTITAPIYSVANANGVELVSFHVPWQIAGRAQAQVVVTRDGLSSAAVTVPVITHQPGVFSLDGANAIAVHSSNYTLVTQSAPLTTGEFAFVYAVGMGSVSNAPATGAGGPAGPLAQTQSTVGVTIGGVPCEVPFAGLAPGLVGVYQINFRVPAGLTGSSANLVVRAAGVDSPPLAVPLR